MPNKNHLKIEREYHKKFIIFKMNFKNTKH